MVRASDLIGLSVVTAAEVRDGIAKANRGGAIRKARVLRQWWDTVEHLYGSRILPFDLATARVAGTLMDKARAFGFAPGFADIAIAATARRNNLTLLTRYVRHFQAFYIAVINPFETPPAF